MKSLLIIDDDEDLGDALLTFFTKEGYSTRLAPSGKQGLALARAEAPHIVLLDWQMPQMGGFQVLQQFAASTRLKDIPVILMSANIGDIPADCLSSHRYMRKPLTVDAIIALVAQVLAAS